MSVAYLSVGTFTSVFFLLILVGGVTGVCPSAVSLAVHLFSWREREFKVGCPPFPCWMGLRSKKISFGTRMEIVNLDVR
jgi:hypothetical protein